MADFYNDYISNTDNFDLKNLPKIRNEIDRSKLAKIVLAQNSDSSELVKSNIQLLKNDSTYTVVTGQQLGVLGGPLYTFYKLLNTVQVCTELKKHHPDKSFVPIFWLEGEDADFDEVSFVKFFKNDEVEILNYVDQQVGSIGKRVLEETIDIFENDSFKSGTQWVDAFRSFFKPIFDEFGIISFHSNRDDVREYVKPFWNTYIENARIFKESVQSTSQELQDDGYKLQVLVKDSETFSFTHKPEGRIKVRSLDELLLEDELSPNVLLRPLMQDWILPTAVYVAGAAEIVYQKQLAKSYELFGLTQPILYPRTHVTIINKKTRRLLDKYYITENITLKEFKEFKSRVFLSEKNNRLDTLKEELYNTIDSFYEDLETLKFADKNSMDKILEGSKSKQMKGFEQVVGRVTSMLKRADEDKLKQINYLENILFPEGKPQERVYPVVQFTEELNSLAKQFFAQITIYNTEWQYLELE